MKRLCPTLLCPVLFLFMSVVVLADDASWLQSKGTLLFADTFDREEDGNGMKALGKGWESATADRAPHIKQANALAAATNVSKAAA